MKIQKNKLSATRSLSLLSLALWMFMSVAGYAHGGEKHEKKKESVTQSEAGSNIEGKHDHGDEHGNSGMDMQAEKKVMAPLSDFPNLHPLLVHFPVVLLVLALITQLFSFFVYQKALSWVTLLLLLFGFAGAWVASEYAHPHTTGLSEYAYKVLLEHERFASITVWSSGIALLLKIISHFFLRMKLWTEILVALLLIVSASAVSLAGHHGAQLVHIEGVGPMGKYLETGDHEH